MQLLDIGTYQVIVNVSLGNSILSIAADALSGQGAAVMSAQQAVERAAEMYFNNQIASGSPQFELPIVSKLAKILSFNSTGLDSNNNAQWTFVIELDENPIGVDDLIAALAVLAGIAAVCLILVSVSKIANNLAQALKATGDSLLPIAILGLIGFVIYKYA